MGVHEQVRMRDADSSPSWRVREAINHVRRRTGNWHRGLAARLERVTKLEQEISHLRERLDALTAPSTPPPHSRAEQHARVGENCTIDPTVRVNASRATDIVIGNRVTIYRDTDILGPARIGSGTFINRACYIRPNTTIGERVNIGPFVRLITDGHDLGGPRRRAGANRWDPIAVGAGSWIGAGAIILGGVTIGEGSIVAAGAVVTKDVPSNTLVGGIPARILRELRAKAPRQLGDE